MALKEPKSMDECIYFTNRSIKNGNAKAWVFKVMCPKCNKALMAKPRDPKTGKPKIRALEYVCPSCNHTEEKKEHEERLMMCVKYKCPECSNQDETEIPFKRKKIQQFDVEKQKKVSADAVQFQCSKCNEKINITKKMK
jgi:predicted RNA-binding Zn-ribbon protein involved in translation (DUF1610 family)